MRSKSSLKTLIASSTAALALGIGLVACSSSNVAGPAAATVHVRGTAGYSMDAVTISVGQTVTWIWDEGGHSVTSSNMVGGLPACTPNGQFDSGTLAAGATFSHTFTSAGTFGYYCKTAGHCPAPTFESAVVVVQ